MRTHHKPLNPGFAPGQPDWDWFKVANARLHDGFVAVSEEWQAFVGRRVEEDLHLWQALTGAKAPEALWSAYTKFWQKTFEDYRNEYLTLSRLYAGAITSGTPAPPQVSEGAFPHSKAA
ncbi:MAG TPA: phasin family protein [Hyphomicrobiaceae bacterium]|nr:phasin family protein [Hyphomicrobiaceae bacterium]